MESQANLILPRIATLPVSLSYSAPSYSKSAFILSPGSVHYRGFSSVQPNEGDSPSQLTPPVPSSIDLYAGGSYTFSTDTYISAPADDDGVTMTFGPATFSGIPSGSDVTVSIDGAGTKDYRRLPYSAPDGMIVTESFTDEPYGNGRSFSRLRRFLGLTFPETGVYITNATASAFGGSSGSNATLDFDIIPLGQPLPTVNQWTVSIVQPNNTTNQPLYTFPVGSDSRGPGTASSIASGGLHVNLPWNGRDSQNQPISGDFAWVMATNVTSSTSGPGGAGTASLRLDQIQKSLKINASANPSNYDPQSGANTTLTFDLEAQGLGTSPNFDWNVAITDPQGAELYAFPRAQGAEGPGNVTAFSGTTRRISLVWNGLASDGQPVLPDFNWVVKASASRLVAGGGGEEQVARATVSNANLNLEVYNNTSTPPQLVSKAFYESKEQKLQLLTEAVRGTNLTVKLKGYRPTGNSPVEVTLKGQRSNIEVRKTMTKQGDDYVVSLPSSELLQPLLGTSLYLHENGDTVDSDLLLSLFKQTVGTVTSYAKHGADPTSVGVVELPQLPGPTAAFDQNRTLPTLNNIHAGGYEVVQAKFTQGQRPLEARFRLRNSAEIRYYSGHGWHGANALWGISDPSSQKGSGKQSNYYGGNHTVYNGVLDTTTLTINSKFQPVEPQEIASQDDFKGAKLWIIAGCSILDIFDLNGNYKYAYQFTRGWQNGEEWFNLGGGLNHVTFCGYNFEGAPDGSGTPTAVLQNIFSRLGPNVKDYSRWARAWMDANIEVDVFDNACAIDTQGTYYYVKFNETLLKSRRPYGADYHVYHLNRSLRSMKYSDWANKNYSLDTVNKKRQTLRTQFSTQIKALPDISFYANQ